MIPVDVDSNAFCSQIFFAKGRRFCLKADGQKTRLDVKYYLRNGTETVGSNTILYFKNTISASLDQGLLGALILA